MFIWLRSTPLFAARCLFALLNLLEQSKFLALQGRTPSGTAPGANRGQRTNDWEPNDEAERPERFAVLELSRPQTVLRTSNPTRIRTHCPKAREKAALFSIGAA